jgi:hypothetical protein
MHRYTPAPRSAQARFLFDSEEIAEQSALASVIPNTVSRRVHDPISIRVNRRRRNEGTEGESLEIQAFHNVANEISLNEQTKMDAVVRNNQAYKERIGI